MNLTSSTFAQNDAIPKMYTCEGDNVHPPLAIRDVPEYARTLALIVDDPDAPSGTFLHWTIWNISPERGELEAGVVPEEACEGVTSFGATGYGGPCPPSGDGPHRYFFRLYALDTELDVPNGSSRQELEDAMEGHVIGSTELMGVYERA